MKLPRLREWREARGFSQSELSAASGVQLATISRIETGHSNPMPRTARKLAEALNIEVADLLESPPVPLAAAR